MIDTLRINWIDNLKIVKIYGSLFFEVVELSRVVNALQKSMDIL